MRIVAGKYRGRVLAGPIGRGTRPTADRVREALFSILSSEQDIDGEHVLDVFAGSGALGFEALSRGAASVTLIENDPEACGVIDQNIKKLAASGEAKLVPVDALKPPKAKQPFSLILIDAPYGKGMGEASLAALEKQGWIGPEPRIVVEVGAAEPFTAPKGFFVTDERKYGAARLVFARRQGSTSPE